MCFSGDYTYFRSRKQPGDRLVTGASVALFRLSELQLEHSITIADPLSVLKPLS